MFDFSDSVIDTRDIQDRIDEIEDDIELLEGEISELSEEIDEIEEAEEDGNQSIIDIKLDDIEDKQEQIAELKQELSVLLDIKSEVPEFSYGNTLINESYWVEYVEDMVTDCGYVSRDMPWWIAIDWEKTAENVAQDYSTIELDGNTFYYRNC